MKRALTTAQLVAAGVVANRLRYGISRRPPLAPTAARANVSIVIPARDEALRISACIKSVLRHSDVVEIIVVDDGSSDNTSAVARNAGATVVRADALPREWVGKPWALQTGLDHSTGDIVVFLDADVRLSGDAISALVDELSSYDVVSLSARLATSSPLEQALSASMVATLVYRFGPVGRASQPAAKRVMGNGQCLAMRRSDLLAEGGFKHSAHHMTDDIALLRALADRGLRVGFLDGSDLITTEMYSSASETWREWPRSLPMNDVTSVAGRAADTVTLWLTMVLPALRFFTGRSTVTDKVLLAQRVAISAALMNSYEKPRAAVLLSPLADVAVVARLTWTTIKPVRRWRGRQYEPPKTGRQ